MANKSKDASAPGAQRNGDAAAASSLIICRNKHWRYISSYHGPWLQLPPEILESLAHQNYTMPHPRLIDPAVFYDVVKIRRAVDEATEDAVRASTGQSSTQSNASLGRLDPWGGAGGVGPKMSKERIHKVRQKAVKLLAKAYTLDEVAASVATMQSTSSLEDVALHVLKREKNDHDAKYVHFFHEKIPSRMMEHYTPLDPLNEVIQTLPWEAQAAPLRTRALVQIFKSDFESAAIDFTLALRIAQELNARHKPGADQLVLATHFKDEQDSWNRSGKDWRSVPHLKEEDQPNSLEQQMLFNRAGVYLTIACNYVHTALDGLEEYQKRAQVQSDSAVNGAAAPLSQAEKQAHQARLEARKKVKTCAKRAMKDYVGFLAHFDYTPGLPFEIINEIMRRVYDLANGTKSQNMLLRHRMAEANGSNDHNDDGLVGDTLVRHQKSGQQNGSGLEWDADGWPRVPEPQIHPASALFAEKPPPGLPEFPASKAQAPTTHPLSVGSREAVTYHPLLADALHSLLLSHALLQTSPTELLRHAQNAARLVRVADGYPIFQAARSPARADWIEVVRRSNNWIGLSLSWQTLCQPEALPTDTGGGSKNGSHGGDEGQVARSHAKTALETAEQKRERRKQEAILDALADERVVDEESFQRAVRARERRAIEDEEGPRGLANGKTIAGVVDGAEAPEEANGSSNGTSGPAATSLPPPRKAAQVDSKEYPISTERAEAIARWIREAPLSMGGVKKKRPTKKKARPAAADGVDEARDRIDKLGLDDEKADEEVD